MNVHDQLNELAALVRGAKAMPMSSSCLVNRAEMLDVLQRLRDELPATLEHADAVLSNRDAVLAAGRQQAELILEGARAEREQLIEQSEVMVAALAGATAVTTAAQAEWARLRSDADDYVERKLAESTRLSADADDYVDRKLAELEVLLGALAAQANNGRLRLTARRVADLARFQQGAQGPARQQDVPAETPVGAGGEALDPQGSAATGAPVRAR